MNMLLSESEVAIGTIHGIECLRLCRRLCCQDCVLDRLVVGTVQPEVVVYKIFEEGVVPDLFFAPRMCRNGVDWL
jgi:hypothetical protein